jgi:replicative DNA helicase
LEAEAAVLSAAMLDAGALDAAVAILRPEHFYSTANELVFGACAALAAASKPVDVVSVAGWLREREQIQRVGGGGYLGQLVDATPAVAHVDHHAQIVREKWRLRELIRACQQFAAEGYGDVGEVQDFLTLAEQTIAAVARDSGSADRAILLRDALGARFDAMDREAKTGVDAVPTPSSDLNKLFAGGWRAGDLTILAARPGFGKSSWAMQALIAAALPPAEQRAEHDRRGGVAGYSLEMSRDQLVDKLVCQESRTDTIKLRERSLTEADWQYITGGCARLGALPVLIDDTASLNIVTLSAKARQARRALEKLGVKLVLVVIDYLQLLQPTPATARANREQQVEEASRGAKILAKELDCHVLALSQLNRSCETRGGDKRPMLSDLRSSGALEQDADNVLMLYNDERYNPDTQARGLVEVLIAKQRNGPTGKVVMKWWDSCTRFDNLAAGDWNGNDYD